MTLLSYKQKNWAHICRFLNNLYNFCYLSKDYAVLQIHYILVWIRIRIRLRKSMPLTNGSRIRIRIPLFSSLTFKMPTKN